MAARTQDSLYAEIDLDLSWSERELPQRERTKHVHGLHPYQGKFPPQLAEALLRRHLAPGQTVLDPFAGSGTTLVEAVALGIGAVGCEISAFNAMLCREKLQAHAPGVPEAALGRTLARAGELAAAARFRPQPPPYVRRWHGAAAQRELMAFRAAMSDAGGARGLAALVLSRAARSSRQVPHHDLDGAAEPAREPYWCHKHARECLPTEGAERFLRRYAGDVVRRLRAFEAVRSEVPWRVLHADARALALDGPLDGIVTSPPYVGVLDYHGQHAYAYELLGLPERSSDEIGSRRRGITRRAIDAYATDMADALGRSAASLRPGAPVVIVVNDRLGLYEGILERAGLMVESRSARHVNRRTGRRKGEYYEDVIVARTR